MTGEDIVKIGEEMVKVLSPVYDKLDKFEGEFVKIGQKLDALMADVIQLQDEVKKLNKVIEKG